MIFFFVTIDEKNYKWLNCIVDMSYIDSFVYSKIQSQWRFILRYELVDSQNVLNRKIRNLNRKVRFEAWIIWKLVKWYFENKIWLKNQIIGSCIN